MARSKRRRRGRWVLIGVLVLLVTAAIAVTVGVFYVRSILSARSVPIEGRYFVAADTSAALLVRLRPGDSGVLELWTQLARACDEGAEGRLTTSGRLGLFLLGLGRPSDLITRPLPAEIAVVVRRDAQQAAFHSYAVCSVSGLAPLARAFARHFGRVAPVAAARYGKRTHSDETIFAPDNGAGPPSPRLDPRDLLALFPPRLTSDACWSVVGNNILVSRRAASLGPAIDRLKAIYAEATEGERVPIRALLGFESDDADVAGAVLNGHGELACLLGLLAEVTDASALRDWLRSDVGANDVAAIERLVVSGDVQPGDRFLLTFTLMSSDFQAAVRVSRVLAGALAAWRAPDPIALKAEAGPKPGAMEVRVTVTGVGGYVRHLGAPAER